MSSENSFLSRWARRKQAVKAAEFSPPEAPAAEPVRNAATAPAEPPPPVPADAGPEPLPSIDDLTADSDISAFLRKGVPEALKQAALRKAWALDPAIRDHIGPADYAWDYNDPGSIPGFGGSIKSAAEKLASLSSGGELPPPPPPAPAAPPPSGSVRLSQAAPPAAEAADRPAAPAEASDTPGPAPQGEPPSAAASSSEAPPDGPPPPRHGGALPR